MIGFASTVRLLVASVAFVPLVGCAAGARPPSTASEAHAPKSIQATDTIITRTRVTTEVELASSAELALVQHRYQEAEESLTTLLSARPDSARADSYLFQLASSYEGLENRVRAREVYSDLAARFPKSAHAKAALARAATLQAYLQDWKGLVETADAILKRPDADSVDRILALGARGLGRAELALERRDGQKIDAALLTRAELDVLDGLELSDRTHYASKNVLPVAAAQLRFALGEVRRGKSELIELNSGDPDFAAKLEKRCVELLLAQSAYAETVRSEDPHWALLAGFRVGVMYRALHRDLMRVPAPKEAKTERQTQLFYAIMHVRYRVLLEKGLIQLDATIAAAARFGDRSSWLERAREARREMLRDIEDEKAQIARFPFTEEEIQKVIGEFQKRAAEQAKKASR